MRIHFHSLLISIEIPGSSLSHCYFFNLCARDTTNSPCQYDIFDLSDSSLTHFNCTCLDGILCHESRGTFRLGCLEKYLCSFHAMSFSVGSRLKLFEGDESLCSDLSGRGIASNKVIW